MLSGLITHTQINVDFGCDIGADLAIAGIVDQAGIKDRIAFIGVDQTNIIEFDDVGLQQQIRTEQGNCGRKCCRRCEQEIAFFCAACRIRISIPNRRSNIGRDIICQVEAACPKIFVQVRIADFGAALLTVIKAIYEILAIGIARNIAAEIFEAQFARSFALRICKGETHVEFDVCRGAEFADKLRSNELTFKPTSILLLQCSDRRQRLTRADAQPCLLDCVADKDIGPAQLLVTGFNAETDHCVGNDPIVCENPPEIEFLLRQIRRCCCLLDRIAGPPFVAVSSGCKNTERCIVADFKAGATRQTRRAIDWKMFVALDHAIASGHQFRCNRLGVDVAFTYPSAAVQVTL